jgi:hypothetical protein
MTREDDESRLSQARTRRRPRAGLMPRSTPERAGSRSVPAGTDDPRRRPSGQAKARPDAGCGLRRPAGAGSTPRSAAWSWARAGVGCAARQGRSSAAAGGHGRGEVAGAGASGLRCAAGTGPTQSPVVPGGLGAAGVGCAPGAGSNAEAGGLVTQGPVVLGRGRGPGPRAWPVWVLPCGRGQFQRGGRGSGLTGSWARPVRAAAYGEGS